VAYCVVLAAVLLPVTAAANAYVGSAACRGCHPAIFKSYSVTPMALSSGRTGSGSFRESFARGEFAAADSDGQYRVSQEPGGYFLEFTSGAIHARRRLDYFIGSGAAGRSYASTVRGFLFQAPVSYYSAAARWDLSPGYEKISGLLLTRPIDPECLQCHATRLQPAAGTENGYREPPFLEGGIGCERCHGPGEEHVARKAKAVNPAKLAPGLRDSACAQCHLTGVARIAKLGRGQATFQPGALLSDHLVPFVWSGGDPEMKVTSHYEKLAQSRCKQASGDRLWCGTCHDAHSVPDAASRAAWFRTKCIGCHAQAHRREEDCAACHMPKNAVINVDHAVYTDHSIRRNAAAAERPAVTERTLVPFGQFRGDERDLALAYAAAGENGRAFEMLRRIVSQRADDEQVLAQLAALHDRRGEADQAVSLYHEALRRNPARVAAAVNLGILLMKRNQPQEAIRLWTDALARSPGLEAARLNLAVVRYRAGDRRAANATLLEGLEYNPGSAGMRRMLAELDAVR
jgi:Tetratricopeptide repeat/Cytochrome c554 and c-prime